MDKIRFLGAENEISRVPFGSILKETREKTTVENEDTLLSCAINGIFRNDELFSHFRGSSTIGYIKVKKNDLILSAQNLHLGNANVNLRFEHGIISPAYKVYRITGAEPEYIAQWVKRPAANQFFLAATTEGASQCRKNIDWDALYRQPIVLPSSDEQKKIAKLLMSLDSQIAFEKTEVRKLKDFKSAMLTKMFPKEGKTEPEIRFPGFTDAWEQRKFDEAFIERRDKTEKENEDILLSCAINGMFLNSELFGHFRGTTTIGYLRVKKNNLILSAQNLHLGNANVNLRFEHGIISPAYKVYDLNNCNPEFVQSWVKRDDTKKFFLAATTEGASQCRKNIEWETLGKQTISMPSLDEQKRVGSFFSQLDHLITLHQRKYEKLIDTKKAFLEKLIGGEK